MGHFGPTAGTIELLSDVSLETPSIEDGAPSELCIVYWVLSILFIFWYADPPFDDFGHVHGDGVCIWGPGKLFDAINIQIFNVNPYRALPCKIYARENLTRIAVDPRIMGPSPSWTTNPSEKGVGTAAPWMLCDDARNGFLTSNRNSHR